MDSVQGIDPWSLLAHKINPAGQPRRTNKVVVRVGFGHADLETGDEGGSPWALPFAESHARHRVRDFGGRKGRSKI